MSLRRFQVSGVVLLAELDELPMVLVGAYLTAIIQITQEMSLIVHKRLQAVIWAQFIDLYALCVVVELDLELGVILVCNLAVRGRHRIFLVEFHGHLEVLILHRAYITERVVGIVVLRDGRGYVGSSIGSSEHLITRIQNGSI